jgi:hypothetical protein
VAGWATAQTSQNAKDEGVLELLDEDPEAPPPEAANAGADVDDGR